MGLFKHGHYAIANKVETVVLVDEGKVNIVTLYLRGEVFSYNRI
jgi:hypothetical protein